MTDAILRGKKGKYIPGMKEPYELSRSKVELFQSCRRCFWLDRRCGIAPPGPAPYTLNSAVDELLKREFDGFRATHEVPPLLKKQGLLLYPAQRSELDQWRNNLKGVRVHDTTTNLIVYGAIDDLWVDETGTYYVADYKATAKNGEVSLDADWQIAYKRQVEFYQWLLRGNGLPVSNEAWFVYANGKRDRSSFDGTLFFEISLIPYKGTSDWVGPTLKDIVSLLYEPHPPASAPSCDVCAFVTRAAEQG
jgi:hypothetical protein